MATLKELSQFIGITESGIKYKKKYNPTEFLLIELGYEYLYKMSEFDRSPIMIKLRNKVKVAEELKEKNRQKVKANKEGL